MQVIFQLTPRDYHNAFIAHLESRPLRRWTRRIFIVLIAIQICFAWAALNLLVRNWKDWLSLAPITAALASSLLILYGLPRWLARNLFCKPPAAPGPRTITVEADGLHWRMDGESGSLAWRLYNSWYESRTVILLFISPALFNIFPKRTFSSAQLAEFRSLLRQHVSRP